MIHKQSALDFLWEFIDMLDLYVDQGEKEYLCRIETKAEKIRKLINQETIKNFEDYQESMFEFCSAMEKEAFFKGVRFAAKLAFEIMKE